MGHEKLNIYKVYAVSVLFNLFLLVISCSGIHEDLLLTLISSIGILGIILYRKKTFYSQVSGGKSISKTSKLIVITCFLIGLLTLLLNKSFFYDYLSLTYFPIYILLTGAELNNKNPFLSNFQEANLLKISLFYELILFSTFSLVNFLQVDLKLSVSLFIMSLFHLLLLGLLVVPSVLRHVSLQKVKRIERARLKKKNLTEIANNTTLENKVSSALFYSELASLDIEFLTKVGKRIESSLKIDKDKSSLILTKLAKHLRNQVYFQNQLKGTLKEELSALKDFINLCNTIESNKSIKLITDYNENIGDEIFVRSHIILPSIKAVFKEVFDEKDEAEVLVILKKSNNLLIDIQLKCEGKTLDKTKLGLEYIQSRLLDNQIDFGEIVSVTDTSFSLKLITFQNSNPN